MKKRFIVLFLIFVFAVSLVPGAALAAETRDTSYEESVAAKLKELGLFQGVTDTDFALNRAPTRVEAIVMLIRVLGKEEEALNGTYSHPFTDVPRWANKYIGYAYCSGLTNGVSNTEFGTGTAGAQMYVTFMLRALGYSDENNLDFNWKNPYNLASSIGILPEEADLGTFLRADVVLISYAALPAKLKNSDTTLAQRLISAGVFTQAQYDALVSGNTTSSDAENAGEAAPAEGNNNNSAGTDENPVLNSEQIYAKCSPAVFYIEIYNASGTATSSGSGFFLESDGTAVTNYHVIDDAASAKIRTSDSGKEYSVLGVYACSEEEDWAVIKVDGDGFSTLKPGSDDTIVGGAQIYAIGSPLGLENSISEGIISNTNRPVDNVGYIQITAPISHGSSGGALINKYGEVIGITSASYVDGQNLNLALPISIISGYSKSSITPLNKLSSSSGSGSSGSSSGSTPAPSGTVFKYLADYCRKNGSVTNSGTYTVTLKYAVQSTYSAFYSITYDPADNELTLSDLDQNNNGSTDFYILTIPASLSGIYDVGYLYSANGSTTSYYGFASIRASAFTSGSTLYFSNYSGSGRYKTVDAENTVIAISNALYLLNSKILSGSGYTLSDLGFTSYY